MKALATGNRLKINCLLFITPVILSDLFTFYNLYLRNDDTSQHNDFRTFYNILFTCMFHWNPPNQLDLNHSDYVLHIYNLQEAWMILKPPQGRPTQCFNKIKANLRFQGHVTLRGHVTTKSIYSKVVIL